MNASGEAETSHEALYHQDVIRRVLALREDLVRHDENLKAYHLLNAVPYFIDEHPAIVAARADQLAMVEHVVDEAAGQAYRDYYAGNPHERPFEEQYGLSVEQSHRIPRVQFLLDGLATQADAQEGDKTARRGALRVLDLSANDGWMAARLAVSGYRCDCVDLHPGNCALARERKRQYPLIGEVWQADLHDTVQVLDRGHDPYSYDAVVLFETIEHVQDPAETLAVMRRLVKPGGRLYVSTPAGSVEQGNLPQWDHIEPKGHVRVYTPASFRAELEQVGEVEEIQLGPDGVLVARVKPQ